MLPTFSLAASGGICAAAREKAITLPRETAICAAKFITVAEAARYCSLSESSLRRLIAAGRLSAYRPGVRRTLLSVEQLDAYMQASAAAPQSV
jgi:excisionase family DNA binding protein